jgi:hypothetical protein
MMKITQKPYTEIAGSKVSYTKIMELSGIENGKALKIDSFNC